jgi:predicted metal-dependent peptidase
MNRLREAITALVSVEPFYGHLILNMRIVKDNTCPTAGVWVTDKVNLCYNEDYVNSLSLNSACKLLKHECEHIFREHIARAKQIGATSKEQHKRFNISTDATINRHDLLSSAKEHGWVTVAGINEQLKGLIEKHNAKPENKADQRTFTSLDDGQIAEYYYNKINEFADQNGDLLPQSGDGFGETDDHSQWEKSEGSAEVQKEVIKDSVNNAVKKAGGIGNVSGDIASIVAKLNESQVNWKQQLRQAVVKTQKSLRENTRKRRNRRYGILQPGIKRKPVVKIAVPVDTSGSMCGEPLRHAWAELASIHSASEVEITVIEADCGVKNTYEFDPKKTPQFVGGGGTAYGPALEKAKELKVDLIIYIGDMDAADTPKDPKIPVIWCVTGTSKPPADFGKAVYVKVGEDRV